jgi:mono/diheme cytochrome c family protein
MPAYGKTLNPAEVDALVAYLVTLRPNYRPAARDSAVPASLSDHEAGAQPGKPKGE